MSKIIRTVDPSGQEWVSLSRQHYDALVKRHEHLSRLEARGVDNWDGYCGEGDDDETEEEIYG